MVYDLAMLKAFYTLYEGKIERIRTILQRPLTLAEKILYAHLYDEKNSSDKQRTWASPEKSSGEFAGILPHRAEVTITR